MEEGHWHFFAVIRRNVDLFEFKGILDDLRTGELFVRGEFELFGFEIELIEFAKGHGRSEAEKKF